MKQAAKLAVIASLFFSLVLAKPASASLGKCVRAVTASVVLAGVGLFAWNHLPPANQPPAQRPVTQANGLAIEVAKLKALIAEDEKEIERLQAIVEDKLARIHAGEEISDELITALVQDYRAILFREAKRSNHLLDIRDSLTRQQTGARWEDIQQADKLNRVLNSLAWSHQLESHLQSLVKELDVLQEKIRNLEQVKSPTVQQQAQLRLLTRLYFSQLETFSLIYRSYCDSGEEVEQYVRAAPTQREHLWDLSHFQEWEKRIRARIAALKKILEENPDDVISTLSLKTLEPTGITKQSPAAKVKTSPKEQPGQQGGNEE